MFIFGIFCVVVIVLVVYGVVLTVRARESAKRAYWESLDRLKTDPTNASLRQETLRLGRVYSNLTRDNKGITVYDEVALSNDIEAACAGAVNMTKQSIEGRLGKLSQLLANNFIDEQEYNRRRQSILGEV